MKTILFAPHLHRIDRDERTVWFKLAKPRSGSTQSTFRLTADPKTGLLSFKS